VPARLKPALQRDEPEALRALVDMTPLLLEKCGRAYVSEHVVPMLCKALAKEGHAPLQVQPLLPLALYSYFSKRISVTVSTTVALLSSYSQSLKHFYCNKSIQLTVLPCY
jgi:hypothetical protein